MKSRQDVIFPPDFLFGVANASAQVEDQLDDLWMHAAKKGSIPNFQNHDFPEDKLKFWTAPEKELDLARELGCQVFRLSLDWGRLCPEAGVWNEAASLRYKEILAAVEGRGMKVMVTLFHHSVPSWFAENGGWKNASSIDHFLFFARKCVENFESEVDFWITLNEPVPWSFLTYKEGLFPPQVKGTIFDHFNALSSMVEAHKSFYKTFSGKIRGKIGFSHHIGAHKGRGIFNQLLSVLSDHLAHWSFLKKLRASVDFLGVNYYGSEWISLKGPEQLDELEYSDAGRCVNPKGLRQILGKVHRLCPGTEVYITENGIGDATDWVRPAYLLEHLAAVNSAIKMGVPVKGYMYWTLSDNFEWTDGYGPKFGLVEVKREEGLKRVPRNSFYLYQDVIANRGFTHAKRAEAWDLYLSHKGEARPFWRGEDNKSCLAIPKMRKTTANDWRLK